MTPYENVPAVNWSSLKHLAVSPLLYKWRLEHPQPDSATLVVGAAIHCALLEPGKFDSRYAVFDGRRAGKEWDKWQDDHPGVKSLKPDEMERVTRSAEAVRAHRIARHLLEGCRAEEPTTWVDPDTGLKCKGRIDAIAPGFVLDLKSARDVEPKWFRRAAADYLYHGQLAFYHDGATVARKIPGDAEPYIIAAQSDEPFDVATFQLAPDTLGAGRALYRSLLRRLVECQEADFWPGTAPDLEMLDLPPWAEGQNNTVTQEGF